VRSLSQIQQEQEGRRTLRNMAGVLQAKLELLTLYGAYEYDAGEEQMEECAQLFRELAQSERAEVDQLLAVLARAQTHGRFGSAGAEVGGRSPQG
jgi:rubrerythrin